LEGIPDVLCLVLVILKARSTKESSDMKKDVDAAAHVGCCLWV
jgi:hypothetical protein